MIDEDWGLSSRGFHRPTYTVILDAIEYKAREHFGDTANLTVRSPLGMFLRIFAWIVNILFMLLEDIYNSQFIDTAVGTSLYNLGCSIGLRLLPITKASGFITVTGTPATAIPTGYLVANIEGVNYVVMTDGVIGAGGTVTLPIQAVNAGSGGNTAASTITRAVTVLDGVATVTNTAALTNGREMETDEQFRDRYYKSVDFSGGVNADAIRAEIMQSAAGVLSALVFENDADETTASGMPPHSIEAIVYGGSDTDIAQAIYSRKAGGIQTVGATVISVVTASGQALPVRFNRPTAVPVWIKIENLVTTAQFPDDGEDQIIDALLSYVGDSVSGGLTIGEDVVYNRLPAVVFTVSGVSDFALSVSSDGSAYAAQNIDIAAREKAVTDSGKVTIV